MIEIFNELYKKVLGFFQTQEKEEPSESKTVAVNRMKLVLMQDRTNLTPYLLERMRGEMIDVLAKYVEMDKEALELNFEQEGDQMALMLSIPVLRAKEEDEIQAMIKAEEEEKERVKREEEREEADESEPDSAKASSGIKETEEVVNEVFESEDKTEDAEESEAEEISDEETKVEQESEETEEVEGPIKAKIKTALNKNKK